MPGMFRVRGVYTTTKTQIICRTVSDKRHKIIAEVRLIVVAGLPRNQLWGSVRLSEDEKPSQAAHW
jgi:hypothetical protein